MQAEDGKLLSQNDAVQLVSEHLKERGFEVDHVDHKFGGTPIIVTRGGDIRTQLRITFGHGVLTCCGPKSDPRDWETTVQHLRAERDLLQALAQPVEASSITSHPNEAELLRRILRLLGLSNPCPEDLQRLENLRRSWMGPDRGEDRPVKAVVFEGSVEGREDDLKGLVEELDTPLIVIDSERRVASAGLECSRDA